MLFPLSSAMTINRIIQASCNESLDSGLSLNITQVSLNNDQVSMFMVSSQ